MTTLTHKEKIKSDRAIMVQCALIDAILADDKELIDLMTEQRIDDVGKAPGEFLGGNGQAQWSHVKGHIVENSGIEDKDGDYAERSILEAVVTEHQTSIEVNGSYNVRQTARWKSGTYDAEKAQEAQEARHLKALDMHRTKVAARDHRNADTYANRKAKRLAKLAARRGVKA